MANHQQIDQYELAGPLQRGLECLDLFATQEQQQKLLLLLEQLFKWNKTYNLTAIKQPKQGLNLHVLDSLAVVPFITQKTLLDVGTGAGFPGLPLAIMLPNVTFTVLDSNSKKIRFIRQQIHNLQLTNIRAVHSRVEDFIEGKFELIISRAFASIHDMLSITNHLLAENGHWLAMKGVYSSEEIQQVSKIAIEKKVHMLNVPGLAAERCLIDLIPIT
jgi:16S rRNA (guanine527-N7)-methyltransferase